MGGDHHGHGHHDFGPKARIPDYRIYKVEDAPELVKLRDRLAAKGLKDPWMRNEVWRYDPRMWGTKRSRFANMLPGWKWGVVAFVATIAVETAFDKLSPKSEDHGHH